MCLILASTLHACLLQASRVAVLDMVDSILEFAEEEEEEGLQGAPHQGEALLRGDVRRR